MVFRIAGLCKDYCGLLNEESIRLNFVLVYELLDEVMVSKCILVLHLRGKEGEGGGGGGGEGRGGRR